MPQKKSAGYVIFAVCTVLAGRLILFQPEKREPTAAELRWGTVQESRDSFGFIRGLRYYILGIGVLGLLVDLDDERTAARKAAKEKAEAAKAPPPRPPQTPPMA
jgi:hypothetical protein